MQNIDGPDANSSSGYTSSHAKTIFTITTGILGTIFFFAQFLAPFFILWALERSDFSDAFSFGTTNLSHSAFWNGQLWYVRSSVNRKNSRAVAQTLYSMAIGPKQKPVQHARLSFQDPWLLAAPERLWMVSSETLACYQNGSVQWFHPGEKLGDISRPFLSAEGPTVLELVPSGTVVKTFIHGNWKRRASWSFAPASVKDLQVVQIGNEAHLFLNVGGTLYYWKMAPGAAQPSVDTWEPVSRMGASWSSLALNGEPVVFGIEYGEHSAQGLEPKLMGYHKTAKGWRSFFSHPVGAFQQAAVFAAGSQMLIALKNPLMGPIQTVMSDAQHLESTPWPTPSPRFPFHEGMLKIILLPQAINLLLPLVLAFILTLLMRKYRLSDYSAGALHSALGSLWRRALAQSIDLVLVIGVMGYFWFFWLQDFEKNFTGPAMAKIILGPILWLLGCLIVFSYMEGRWGRSPGKWITGLKVVGTDLQPCGFGRALIRNLLKVVDGFFNCTTGILLMALSENWQRVGDMAARTVVINHG